MKFPWDIALPSTTDKRSFDEARPAVAPAAAIPPRRATACRWWVSNVAALTEMITNRETGLIFAKGDVGNLADVLARLIGDPALRARLGRNGRDWVASQRTWTGMGRRVAARLTALRCGQPEGV